MVSRQETSYSTFAFSLNFVTMDVRGSRDLEGARVAMDTDPRCIHALGMDKRLGFPDLEGLRLAMDADPRGTLAIGVDERLGSRGPDGVRFAIDADPRGIRVLGVPRWREVQD